jgi:TM2 domain-containing membrane protein YozV
MTTEQIIYAGFVLVLIVLIVLSIGVGRFFSGRGAAVVVSEVIYVWLPLPLIWTGVWMGRKGGKK